MICEHCGQPIELLFLTWQHTSNGFVLCNLHDPDGTTWAKPKEEK